MSEYTNEQLHEAYSVEHHAHKQTQEALKRSQKEVAQIRYERDKFMEDWLKLHIRENVFIVGDMDEAIEVTFSMPHKIFFTPGKGYYVIMLLDDCLFISFAWYDGTKTEHRNMAELIRNIARSYQQPVRYTGVNNVLSNHSVEISSNLYELTL